MTAVAAEELGAEITALIARVCAGEEVVITGAMCRVRS